VLVVAKTASREDGRNRLSLFIVDTRAPGLQASPIPMEVVAPERQFTLIFDDVVVPAGRLVGEVDGDGLKQVFAGLNPERINTAAQGIGLGRYFLDKSVAYATDRQVWGAPIGSHQGIAHPLAVAKVNIELAKLMTAKAAWLFDNDLEAGESANMAKYAAGEASMQCFEQAVQTHGGNGFSTEFGIADLWGLTRLLRSAPVSREMALNFVAQHSLGLARSY
jgi:alkylation response protein AidB-like acyl-CoA dehydrogenase